jgi:hypothetical protein
MSREAVACRRHTSIVGVTSCTSEGDLLTYLLHGAESFLSS